MPFQPSFFFPEPDHFTVGTIGPPGKREFYLQAGSEGTAVSFKLEKQQVAALAEYLTSIMADLPAPEGAIEPAPALMEPLTAEWTVGGIGIAVDEASDRILLVIHELVRDDDTMTDGDPFADPETDEDDDDEFDEDSDAAIARLQLSRAQITSFIERALELVAAGRPLCPFCGLPDGPDGHICPRAN